MSFCWQLIDYLGSTAVTANSSGAYVTELRYYPYGGVRYNPGNQVTTDPSLHSGHTGQREDATIGLYFYGARYQACPERSEGTPCWAASPRRIRLCPSRGILAA